MILLCLSAFIAGLFVDGTAVFWVHYSERGEPVKTGLVAMLQAIAQVIGIGESIHDWHAGISYILGYSFGAGICVIIKNKWL